jgi:hypothetical protein
MTPDQLSAIRARLDAARQTLQGVVRVEIHGDVLVTLLNEVERLTNDLAMAQQVSGELCQSCGWAMKFPGEPCRCELLAKVERLTAEREILHELTDKASAEQAQKAREDAFARGAEAMRRAVLRISESRANLPVKDGIEAAWCRSAQCIVDDVRVLTVKDEP